MLKLVKLEDELPVFEPEVRGISVFKKIIERPARYKIAGDSDGRKKKLALMELLFIYFFTDPRSPYWENIKDLDNRILRVKEVVGLPSEWVIDADLEAAIKFYANEIQEDFDVQYLENSIRAAEKTKEWLKDVDYSLRDMKGKPIYIPKEVVNTIKESGGVIEGLKKLREKVYKTLTMNPKIRGGGTIGRYES